MTTIHFWNQIVDKRDRANQRMSTFHEMWTPAKDGQKNSQSIRYCGGYERHAVGEKLHLLSPMDTPFFCITLWSFSYCSMREYQPPLGTRNSYKKCTAIRILITEENFVIDGHDDDGIEFQSFAFMDG